jgi:acetoin utilization deacetylase AcuC-like enzyme
VQRLISALSAAPFARRLAWFRPERATPGELGLIHSQEMIREAKDTAAAGGGMLDPDTLASAESFNAALAAAGSGKTALNLVFVQGFKRVFIPARPPGHHATSSRSMGFCIFNNAALCARLAIEKRMASRVVIIDWDVHHGNGTEEIFYTDKRVLYLSVHQSPLFPGTGYAEDTGLYDGKGFNLNAPLPPDSGNEAYSRVFEEKFKPAIEKFAPQLFIISAGFDGHHRDPLANHNLNAHGYAMMAASVARMASGSPAEGRIIAFLEGGYNPEALAESVVATLGEWLPKESRKDEIPYVM